MESSNVLCLKKWLLENGGGFHEAAQFTEVTSGYSVIASKDIPADSTIVSCPFSLAITEELARTNLSKIFSTEKIKDWTERQWINTYICFHWILSGSRQQRPELAHYPYLETLPASNKLLTSLCFTPQELEAFRGSNLYGATISRRRAWQAEWSQCQAFLKTEVGNADWAEGFTWERYLTATTYLTSRAFPSSILSPAPTLQTTSSTKAVLLPGIDALNHARGHAVSWTVTYPDTSTTATPSPPPRSKGPTFSLVIHKSTKANSELFNNYGPKANLEFILGYGFSIPNNQDDTILLKIGDTRSAGGNQVDSAGEKTWEIGRGARGVEGLWNEVLKAIMQDNGDEEGEEGRKTSGEGEVTYEDQLDAAEMLGEMVQGLMDRLPSEEAIVKEDMRPEVIGMWQDYIDGQRKILSSLLKFSQEKERAVIEQAGSEGVKFVFEE